ncbi:MAG: hypothetical protein EXS14_02440 [Planctomycetes bacterium]|nr:hypothetical protein [Planctomycetota bacterium]
MKQHERKSTRAIPAPRAALVAHVLKVQKSIRTCADCGLCCTEAHNSVRILASEAQRIADYLSSLPAVRQADLRRRLKATVQRAKMRGNAKVNYTCSFLEKDMTCVLPMTVKPVACLAFNPLTPLDCDQEPEWYAKAHVGESKATCALEGKEVLRPIPVAVLRAQDAATATLRKAARHPR